MKPFSETRQYQRVLGYVNRIRAERDLPLLNLLPKGGRGYSHTCPIAIAVEGRQDAKRTSWETWKGDTVYRDSPAYVQDFVDRFDGGNFPELELPDNREEA